MQQSQRHVFFYIIRSSSCQNQAYVSHIKTSLLAHWLEIQVWSAEVWQTDFLPAQHPQIFLVPNDSGPSQSTDQFIRFLTAPSEVKKGFNTTFLTMHNYSPRPVNRG